MNPIELFQLMVNNVLGGLIHNGSSMASNLAVALHLI